MKNVATKRELQSLIGKLIFVSRCIRQSRLFINRMLGLLRKLNGPQYRMRLTNDFKRDLKWWSKFIDTYNGVSIMPETFWSSPDSQFSTDACLLGCRGIHGNFCFHTKFPQFILDKKLDINQLEMLAVVVGLKL